MKIKYKNSGSSSDLMNTITKGIEIILIVVVAAVLYINV